MCCKVDCVQSRAADLLPGVEAEQVEQGGRGAGAPHLPAEGGARPRRGPYPVRGAGAQHCRHPGQGLHDRNHRRETIMSELTFVFLLMFWL